jgi:hypothetical protein
MTFYGTTQEYFACRFGLACRAAASMCDEIAEPQFVLSIALNWEHQTPDHGTGGFRA